MNLRGLCSVVLLLASPLLAQQSVSPTAPARPPEQLTQTPGTPVSEIKVQCISASRAAEMLSKRGCVAGKVFQVTSQKNGSTHISLCPPKSECTFHAVVFASDRDNVGDLSYLHGKLVAFVGDITDYRGHPEIVVKDRKQIHLSAGDPPPHFDAAQSKSASNGQTIRGSTRGRAW